MVLWYCTHRRGRDGHPCGMLEDGVYAGVLGEKRQPHCSRLLRLGDREGGHLFISGAFVLYVHGQSILLHPKKYEQINNKNNKIHGKSSRGGASKLSRLYGGEAREMREV